ncbi:MAG: hypothetical protein PHP30_07915 [Bacteroidales bacterium]|nr:hypothetical protein [Bacteroidales bacterium]MDD2425544.1 hypothetical protein [Bacteroidales bacterium]MDD3990003.1 hypothetical protein [Bacteroidales bacterium]
MKSYGSDKVNWPVFIHKTEQLDDQLLEFKSKQKNPEDRNLYIKFFNNHLGLGTNEKESHSFRKTHNHVNRCYYTLFYYYYSAIAEWGALMDNPNPNPVANTYLQASKTEGWLPVILYKYVSKCPEGLLEWYFDEVFPVIDLLYRQESRDDLLKVLTSIGVHMDKLAANNDFIKAEVWRKSIDIFVNYYVIDALQPKVEGGFRGQKTSYDSLRRERDRAIAEFDKSFSHKVRNNLNDISIKLVYPHKGLEGRDVGNLVFPQVPEEAGKSRLYSHKNYSSDFYIGKIAFEEAFVKDFIKVSDEAIEPERNEKQFTLKASSITTRHQDFVKSATIFRGTNKMIFTNYGNSLGSREWLFAYEDKCFGSNSVVFEIPNLNSCSVNTYMYAHNIPIPQQDAKYLRERLVSFFVQTAEEVYNKAPVSPQIYGMTYQKTERPEYALKVTASAKEIKPDGKSSVTISGQLYSYLQNVANSSTPLKGKTVFAEIVTSDDVIPGSLSSGSLVTDANGVVSFTYNAPAVGTLDKMEPHNRTGVVVRLVCKELGAEDNAYIKFVTDNGKIWAEPGYALLSDTAFVPPDKRYPALVSANFYDDNMEPLANAEVFFSIAGENPSGLLRNKEGITGTKVSAVTDVNGLASVHYFYAKDAPPANRLTETVEARSANMSIPFRAYVTTAFNLVMDKAESGYEGKGTINAGEYIPIKITVKDFWNPNADLENIMSYWGVNESTGTSKLFVKLEIEKQGLVPGYMADMFGEQSYPEPPFREQLRPKNLPGQKNLLYIPHYSANSEGLPRVRPLFSGTNNYEIRITLVDENGVDVFKRAHPGRSAFLSVPTGIPAETFMVWFASNPLGPHTPMARFGRMLLSTITLGEYGSFGSVLSLVDAAFAINSGDAEGLVSIMLSEIKGQVTDDMAQKVGLSGELATLYKNISIAEQYVTYGLTTYSDVGLVAEMESRILSAVAKTSLDALKSLKLIVLVGDGTQELHMEHESQPKQESKLSKALKDNIKIKITGIDQKTADFLGKLGVKSKEKENYVLVPAVDGKYLYDHELKAISLKNGKVSVFMVPAAVATKSENTTITKVF